MSYTDPPEAPGGEAEPAQPRIVRSALDLQRAHDILVSLILNKELRQEIFSTDRLAFECLKANVDVLCWMLGHDHNRTFANNLKGVEHAMEALGHPLIDSGRLRPGSERP